MHNLLLPPDTTVTDTPAVGGPRDRKAVGLEPTHLRTVLDGAIGAAAQPLGQPTRIGIRQKDFGI